MSVFDGRRLLPSVFKLDVERMRDGWYSDKYFINITRMLATLAAQGYRFGGSAEDWGASRWRSGSRDRGRDNEPRRVTQ